MRALWKSPLATGLAMACLALGIGTNATMFSVVSGLLLNPLPFPEPGQLTVVSATRPEGGGRGRRVVRRPGGLPGPGRRLRRAGRGAGTQPDLLGHRRARARARRGGQLAPVLDAGHRPGARPRLHRRRRSAGRCQCRDAQRRAVAAPLQRRPGDRRPAGHRERAALHGDRRAAAAGQVPVPAERVDRADAAGGAHRAREPRSRGVRPARRRADARRRPATSCRRSPPGSPPSIRPTPAGACAPSRSPPTTSRPTCGP